VAPFVLALTTSGRRHGVFDIGIAAGSVGENDTAVPTWRIIQSYPETVPFAVGALAARQLGRATRQGTSRQVARWGGFACSRLPAVAGANKSRGSLSAPAAVRREWD
jgi:hypothetical protein